MNRRIIIYPLIIGFFYLFRAIDFSPFETNFDFSSWENAKLLKWIGMSLVAIIFEEFRIRKKEKKELQED